MVLLILRTSLCQKNIKLYELRLDFTVLRTMANFRNSHSSFLKNYSLKPCCIRVYTGRKKISATKNLNKKEKKRKENSREKKKIKRKRPRYPSHFLLLLLGNTFPSSLCLFLVYLFQLDTHLFLPLLSAHFFPFLLASSHF